MGKIAIHCLGRLLLRLNRDISSALIFGTAVRGAQIGPIDIGPQILTPHRATRDPLNFRAMLRRHGAGTGTPLTQQRCGNPYFSSQFLGR